MGGIIMDHNVSAIEKLESYRLTPDQEYWKAIRLAVFGESNGKTVIDSIYDKSLNEPEQPAV